MQELVIILSLVVAGSILITDSYASHNPNLFVSAENKRFENHFAGSQVVEVIVREPNLNDLDEGKGEPDVTINGKQLRMVQATDGNWYAYFANIDAAKNADEIVKNNGIAGKGLDFGIFCSRDTDSSVFGVTFSDSDGFAVPGKSGLTAFTDGDSSFVKCTGDLATNDLNNVVQSPRSINTNSNVPTGQIGLDKDAWPVIQLFSFDSVNVNYNAAGGNQQVRLDYDEIPNISLTLDREFYPIDSEVFVTVNDFQLNQDPTSEDSWTFSVNSPVATFYQAFDSSGTASANGGTGLTDLNSRLSNLGFENNGELEMKSNSVIEFQRNDNQPDEVTDGSSTFENVITLVEAGPNSGIFESFDDGDRSTIKISSEAKRGQTSTISYNDKSYSIVTGTASASISLDKPSLSIDSESIRPGTKIPVKLVDPDQNINTGAEDDLDVFRSTAIIPSLQIGNPITLEKASSLKFILTDDSKKSASTSVPDSKSDRLIVDASGLEGDNIDGISMNLSIFSSDLKKVLLDSDKNTEDGTNWVNYDLRSFEKEFGINDFSDMTFTLFFGSLDGDSVEITGAGSISSASGLVQIDNSKISEINSEAGQVFLVIDFGVSEGTIPTDLAPLPIVFDIFSFGEKNGSQVNNAIYRFELEESSSNSGTFVGTIEYSVTNQLNQFDAGFIQNLRTIDDEIKFLVNDRLIDERGVSISYSDLAEVGVTVTQSTKSEILTHSGTVSVDSTSYRFGQPVTITLKDPDLNLDDDIRDIYNVISDPNSPNVDTVGRNGKILLEVSIKDVRYKRCTINSITHGGLASTGFSFVETGVNTGIFEGVFKMPTRICNEDGTKLISTAGGSIDARYHDFRDSSGEENIFTLSKSKDSTQFVPPTLSQTKIVTPTVGNEKQLVLTGSVKNPMGGSSLIGKITAPDRSSQSFELSITDSGNYRGLFTIDDNSPVGVYVLKLRYDGAEIGQASFKVVRPDLPPWIKNEAKDWSMDNVADNNFAEVIKFLIEEDFIEGNQKMIFEEKIPSWLKNTVRWWTEGQISDEDFLSSLEYLVKKGIIRV